MNVLGSAEYAWVTIVKSAEDIVNAKLLAASLKRVITSFQSVAICEGQALADLHREELTANGFHHVLSTVGAAKGDDDGHSAASVIRNTPRAKELLGGFRRLGLLPVDSIVLRNCDELLTGDQRSIKNGTDDKDNLAQKLQDCLVLTPGDGEDQEWSETAVSSPSVHVLHPSGNKDLLQDSLENIPLIVRLPNIRVETLSTAIATTSGLWEKKILHYWKILYDNLPSSSSQDKDAHKFPWLAEPIAVIGTAHSCDSVALAVKSVWKDAGLPTTKVASSNYLLATATADPTILVDFTRAVKPALPSTSNVECVTGSSDSPTPNVVVANALQKLQTTGDNATCLLFYKDAGTTISVLALKRVSQAIDNRDQIQAILGPCRPSVSGSLGWTTNGSPNPASNISPTDIIEIIRILNLPGDPQVSLQGLHFIRLSSSHPRESAVIPNFVSLNQASYSLGISLCAAEGFESNYPSWNLKDAFPSERPLHCLALQGENATGLDKIVRNLKSVVDTGIREGCNFADLAYTFNTKLLSSSPWENTGQISRAVLIASDLVEVSKLLNTGSYLKEDSPKMQQRPQQKLCFLFTGQGAQYPGMAQALYKSCPVFRLSLDRCNVLFRQLYNINIHDVIFKESAELSRTLYSQTSIFCVEYALLQTWKSWGIRPDYVVGHSLGEFCAAVCAGALEMEDALKLVAERSRLIDQLPRGKMLVLRGDQKIIQELLDDFTWDYPGSWLDFAAINSKDQTVLSGDSRWIEQFKDYAGKKNVRSIVLEATHAFHSRHMDPMLQKYRKVAETCKGDGIPKGGCVYISGVEGRVVRGPLNPDYWVRHTREPVRFVQASKALWDQGCRVFVECGPQPILTALAKVNMTGLGGGGMGASMTPLFLPSIRRGIDDWKTILNTLAQLWLQDTREVDWRGLDKYSPRKIISPGDSLIKDLQG